MAVNIDSREAPIRAALTTEAKLRTGGEQNALRIKQAMAADAEGTPLEKLDRALGAIKTEKGLGKSKAERLIEENVGVDRDPATGSKILSPEEIARQKSLTKYEKLARELVDKGYDALGRAQKDEAVKYAETILTVSPEIAAIIPADPTGKREFIEDILRAKGFAGLVRGEYAAKFADSEKLEDEVTPAKEQFERAKETERQREAERDRVKRELDETTVKLERFDPGQADDLALDRLTKALPGLETELTENQADLDDASEELKGLQRVQLSRFNRGEDTTAIDTAVEGKKRERKAISGKLKKTSDDIAEQQRLERAKAELPGKKQELIDGLASAEAQLSQATRGRLSLQATADSLREQRREQEQVFVDTARDIIPEALAKYIRQELQVAENAQLEIVREMGEKSADRAQRGISNQILKARWELSRRPTILNRKTTEVNTAQITSDMSTLLKPGERPADPIIKSMLEAEFGADVKAGKMTRNEAKQIVEIKMKDKEFLDSATPLVVESLLRQRLKMGSISEAEADVIVGSEWGTGMLQRAKESGSPQVNAELEALKQAGVVGPEGMTAQQRKRLLWTILFGGLAAGTAISRITK